MKRRYFVHFEITRNCMEAGIRKHEHGSPGIDVFDNLAAKLRSNPDVLQMVEQILDGKAGNVVVGVGREYEEHPCQP